MELVRELLDLNHTNFLINIKFEYLIDLMLPGVITQGPVNLYTFKDVKKDQLCCVCIKGNE